MERRDSMGAFMSGHVFINTKTRKVLVGSQEVDFHKDMTGNKITNINGKVYIDGFKLRNGKWKRTFPALWHRVF